MIAVSGATGQLGRLVIAALLRTVPAGEIVALARDPGKAADLAGAGVVVRQADYNQPETLDAALAGVDRLLLISSSELGARAAQHRAVIDAAKKAGVGLVAYTSVLRADSSPLMLASEHRETEEALAASGLSYVLLRNGWYTENYAGAVATALQHGAVFGSAGTGRVSAAARADYAEAAAAVLTGADQGGRVYELAGDASFSLAELAAEIARRAGKPIVYTDLPEADYAALLRDAGLPEAVAAMLADSDVGISKGALQEDSKQLSQLIGRPTTPFAETLAV